MTACTPLEPQQNPGRITASSQPHPEYPSSTLYPELAQPSKTVPTIEPKQQLTPIPLPSLSILPQPDVQASPNLQIAQLQMFDTTTGWAVYSTPFILPENSKILRTTDGIQNWTNFTPPISENGSNIRAAFFADANTAVVISSRSSLPGSPTVEVIPWRTTDGGQTWQAGETLQIDQASEFYPSQLFFIDSEHGWMLGESDSGMGNTRVHFFKTQDGGIHWGMVYDSANHLSDPDTLWIKGFYPFLGHFTFVSETTGYFSDGRLFRSQDGGRSWVVQPLDPPADLPDLNCNNGNCKYLDTVSAPRFTSSQDGVLIRRAYLNSEIVMDVFVYYPNTQNRLPIPSAQYLYFTHDGGQTWTPKPLPAKIGTVYFWDGNTGWLLGKSDPVPASATQLYQTNDSGETWTQVLADCPLPLGSDLQFVDEKTGYSFYPFAVSDYYKDFDARVTQTSMLLSTLDGGHSWMKVEPQITP
jgi:photosystem II stability/assembly factor-like uncharacterized protein